VIRISIAYPCCISFEVAMDSTYAQSSKASVGTKRKDPPPARVSFDGGAERPKPSVKNARATRTTSKNNSKPPAVTTHGWKKEKRVHVKLLSGDWTEGIISAVKEDCIVEKVQCKYALRVHILNDKGEYVVPPTWHPNPVEIRDSFVHEYVRSVDMDLDSIKDEHEQQQYRVMKAVLNSAKRKKKVSSDGGGDSESGGTKHSSLESLLLEGEHEMNLIDQLVSVSKSADAEETCRRAGTSLGILTAMAFLLGRLAGTELQILGSSKEKGESTNENQRHNSFLLSHLTLSSLPLQLFRWLFMDIGWTCRVRQTGW
jgi:hypothetical protein